MNYEVKRGDNLYNIVKNQYGLTNKTDIMNKVNEIIKNNKIKNGNLIFAGQKLELNEGLNLNSVSIMNPDNGEITNLKDTTENKNYYRANSVFGDIASKPEEYKEQEFEESKLKQITQSTPEVEDVTVDVKAYFTSETARDLQAYDIAAKPAGVGGFKDMNNTDAYKLFLEVNADDFTMHETEFKGNKETKYYLDKTKSDGKVTVFSSELIDGKEYLTMRDKQGNIHYFDKENGLKETTFNQDN